MPTSLPPSLVVETLKIAGYLLNTDHPRGRAKARFFLRCGFDPHDPSGFARALFAHAQQARLETTSENEYGTMLCFRGPLMSPKGEASRDVRTVWQVPFGAEYGRLVTAYPAP